MSKNSFLIMEVTDMGIIPSRNLEDQRREENGVVYFDRGTVTGKNGRRYDRFAIQTHFVQRGESQKELVEKYVRPLYREGDVLQKNKLKARK